MAKIYKEIEGYNIIFGGENMEQPGYGEHITSTIRSLPYDAVIQTEDIARHLAGAVCDTIR